MNNVILMGRICNDLDLRKCGDESYGLNFSLAVNRGYQNADGVEVVDFLPCVIFGGGAKALATFAEKGCRVLINGQLQMNTWLDEDDNKHTTYRVNIDKFNIIDFAKKEEKVEDKPLKAKNSKHKK